MSVLNRSVLEDSPLADLHELASELSIDGFRRLRREELVEAILERQGGTAGGSRRRARKTTRPARSAAPAGAAATTDADAEAPAPPDGAAADAEEEDAPARRRRPRRSRSRAAGTETPEAGAELDVPDAQDEEPARDEDELVEGVVELLPNGSGFVRVAPPEPSDADVYISAAQVKRCELVSGDRVSGPRRAPRRSERFASMVRIDTVNGQPASELADAIRYDDLPAALPAERLALGSEDPTLKAIEWLAPFGRGSRVTITGGPRAGKSEALRRLGDALRQQDELQVSLVLAGVRPEEISEAARGEHPPAGAASLASSADTRAHAIELVVDQARRIASRGGHAVVLIDTLDDLQPGVARRVMAAARNILDGGSLTIIATATQPIGGETTVIALSAALTSTGRFPAIDLAHSGTLRPELLVGDAAAEAIARARAEALE